MNKRQARNLYKVVRALRESEVPEAFDMSCYINFVPSPNDLTVEDEDYPDLEMIARNELIIHKNWCGTPACAFGHFAARSDLQKLCKIKTIPLNIHGVESKIFGEVDIVNKNDLSISHYDIEVLDYFGISYDETAELFNPHGCGNAKTTKQAITYIEKFLKKKGFNLKELA